MGDWLSDLDPRVALGAVMLALISGVAKAFGEVLFGELKLWLKEVEAAEASCPCVSMGQLDGRLDRRHRSPHAVHVLFVRTNDAPAALHLILPGSGYLGLSCGCFTFHGTQFFCMCGAPG